MGASEMPYLYDRPAHQQVAYPYSQFNPKAVTEASYARLSQVSESKQKQEGPLINFNRHPDDYEVWQGRQQDYKPLPPNTKKAVVATRWTQFALRLITEVVALGLLVLTVVMEGTNGAATYLLRIPQAWDSLITLYAIYHLVRPAKARTPASSYSYHTFAIIMDTCLIPLYVYVALVMNTNMQYPPPQYRASGDIVPGQWRFTSLFVGGKTTPDVIQMIVWIEAIGAAALHLLSAGIDLYLIITFRQIALLPPDMNPLEDNLTARPVRGPKHQHKNSEMAVTTNGDDMTLAERKRLAHMSGSTLSVGEQSRLSTTTKLDDIPVPFGHSRNGSKTSLAFSPHNPDSARWSRHQFDGQQEIYRAAASPTRRSRYEIRPDGKLQVRARTGSQSPTKRDSRVEVIDMDISQANHSLATYGMAQAYPTSNQVDASEIGRAISPDMPHAASPRAAQEQEQGRKLLNDNWYVLDADEEERFMETTASRSQGRFSANRGNGYMPVHDRYDSFQPTPNSPSAEDLVPKPLGMHPLTPPFDSHFSDAEDQYEAGVERRPTNATQSSSVYSEESHPKPSTPKGKYYGDLAAATRSILAQNASPAPKYEGRASPDRGARVVSRTGADIADENVMFLHPGENGSKQSMRGLRNREVSGKVAEEGRGGQGGKWGGSWTGRG
ncbi:hypothetical protein LTR62_004287 [Meristemomyces frigidus]|uniref:Uncharacterized protein n=1 Tax=Meristemomyces frigidus TaxID=1508187 RepID=A0AAN7TIB7_9PEZI|nr:hypothetical protein LTR62_004287 [Meristemomyces frigidus]